MTVHVYVSSACIHGKHNKCRYTCKYGEVTEECQCADCDHSELEPHPLDLAQRRDLHARGGLMTIEAILGCASDWVEMEAAIRSVIKDVLTGANSGVNSEPTEPTVAQLKARVVELEERIRKVRALHYLIHRDISWTDPDDGETYEEIDVCGLCVPKHAHFNSRAEVPDGPCATLRAIDGQDEERG